MEVKWKIFLLCLSLLVGVFVVNAAVTYYQKTVDLNWVVVESEGIKVNCSSIYFGEIPKGSNKTAYFTVKNVAGKPLNVSISWPMTLDGQVITVTPQNFILNADQTQTVIVTIWVAEFVQPGTYNRTLYIKAYPIT